MKDTITAVIVLTLLGGALEQAGRNANVFAAPDRAQNGFEVLMRLTPTYWIGRALVFPFGDNQGW